jgi:N6-L-threonylcarbamoyladenine synthase
MNITIIGIESSCDDTSAAVIRDGRILSNVIAGQEVHEEYGGVVPELASRAHQQNIVPVVDLAIKNAGISPGDLSAVAFTRGPGLLGSLLVGVSFAKGLALSLDIPLLEVNHLHAHVLSALVGENDEVLNLPVFPYLCLLVSGGHTQIIRVDNPLSRVVIGETIDDAAGEAFDKCAKVMGLPYPGGPHVDRLAKSGDSSMFSFNKPRIQGLDFSFSGLKTSFLYFLRDQLASNPNYIQLHQANLCASLQKTIIDILLEKLIKASFETGIMNIALAGGVAANSGLRSALHELASRKNWNIMLPNLKYTTDNAAMIALVGYYKYQVGAFADQSVAPAARLD